MEKNSQPKMTSTTVDTVDEKDKLMNPKVVKILESYKNPNISFAYKCLVDRVSKYPVLVDYIKNKIKNNPKIINLITNDWLSILENNLTFQEYMNGKVKFSKYESKTNKIICNYRVQAYSNNINVIAIGTFKITKDKDKVDKYKLNVVECIPVQCIGEIMCLGLDRDIYTNSKFFMKTCNGLCLKCREINVTSDNIWCIQKSIIYEKDKLQYAERKYCTSLFPNEFKAIVHLEINSTYTFGSNCKIGGNVESIVFVENIFDFNEITSINGFLKMDENFIPKEESEKDLKASKTNENCMPHQETEMKPTTETENIESGQEHGIKRRNEDEIENDNKKMLKTNEDTNADTLAIPEGMNYTKPKDKSFRVESTVETMPAV